MMTTCEYTHPEDDSLRCLQSGVLVSTEHSAWTSGAETILATYYHYWCEKHAPEGAKTREVVEH